MRSWMVAALGIALPVFAAAAEPAKTLPAGAKVVLDVWPGVAPGSEKWTQKEITSQFGMGPNTSTVIRNIVKPTFAVFLPEAGKANGAGVIVAPGGGFRLVSIDSEGYEVARWLAAHGIAAFVLKYRTVETPVDNKAFMQAMDKMIRDSMVPGQMNTLDDAAGPAVADAVQTLKLVLAHAGEWQVDPKRVGMVGFSAGGRIVSGVLLEKGAPALAFGAPIYGGPFGAVPSLPAKLPPLFLAAAQDDPLARDPLVRFADALHAGKHDVELHLYASGSHGFGMNHLGTTSDRWIDEFYWWLEAKGFTGKPAAVVAPLPIGPSK